MNGELKPNRSYDSLRRQEQARETRRQITEAARLLFTQHGYAGATIGAIAKQAGVAPETIYASFGSKRAILANLVSVLLAGEDEPGPFLDRPEVRQTEQEHDQRQQVRMFAHQMGEIMSRLAPIFEVMRTAAKKEDDIAEMRAGLLSERRQGMAHFVRALSTHGPLKDSLSVDQAADRVFALSSGEMFNVLVQDLGWSLDQYEAWLADTLIATLLPPQ